MSAGVLSQGLKAVAEHLCCPCPCFLIFYLCLKWSLPILLSSPFQHAPCLGDLSQTHSAL